MYAHENQGGRRHPEMLLEGFLRVVNECNLSDLSYSGSEFTWDKSRGTEAWIQERLDGGLTNNEWKTLFPEAEVKDSWNQVEGRNIVDEVEYLSMQLEEWGGGRMKELRTEIQNLRREMRKFRPRGAAKGNKSYTGHGQWVETMFANVNLRKAKRTQGSNGVVGFKIDVSKAYDRLEWSFLENMMISFGFNEVNEVSTHGNYLGLPMFIGKRENSVFGFLAERVSKKLHGWDNKTISKGDFLNAKLGSNPSYMWRSVMATQDIVKEGSRRNIGNGESTKVWNTPWLSGQGNGLMITDMPAELENTKVVNLMTDNGKEWDEDVINDICNERDKELIKRIPIPSRSTQDS
ncbi:hypothetical protein AgCh_008177 [Apium graveolens]